MIVLVTYKCVIDQASGQDDWILQDIGPVLSFFVFVWTERGQYPAILTDKAWLIKDLLLSIWPKDYAKEFLFCGNKGGNLERQDRPLR